MEGQSIMQQMLDKKNQVSAERKAPLDTVDSVRNLAWAAHAQLNQLYSYRHPYGYHLDQVAAVAADFLHEIADDTKLDLRQETLKACYLHDIIEDCHWSYSDVRAAAGPVVAEIVYAVTDELGRNRSERKTKTLPKIAANRWAVFVKLCDRIANTAYSKETAAESSKSASMLAAYKAEYPGFKAALYRAGEYPGLWALADATHDFL